MPILSSHKLNAQSGQQGTLKGFAEKSTMLGNMILLNVPSLSTLMLHSL